MGDEKKDEDMDVAEDLYVAKDLYEEDDFETGINRGASPARDGAPSPPRMQAMEVDSGTRTLRTVMRGAWPLRRRVGVAQGPFEPALCWQQ